MKKTLYVLMIGLLLMTSEVVKAQPIDNYGIRIGAGLSNQYWKYKTFSDLSGWHDNKVGFTGQVFAEKYLGKYLSIRPAIGYIQKGYVDDIKWVGFEDDPVEISTVNNRVVFHDLSMDMSFKIMPFQKYMKPYLLLGLRGDYLMDYRGVIVDFQGENYELNKEIYNDFNKFTLSGIIGAGISYNELLFMDIEYNPSITKNFESNFMSIHDRYFSLTLGMNINQLLKVKNE